MSDLKRYRKLIISGSVIERLDFYAHPFKRRIKLKEEESQARKRLKEAYGIGSKQPDHEKTDSSVKRARSKVRRIVYANAWAWKDKNGYTIPAKFLTLTFHENIQSLPQANHHLTKYVQRLNYKYAGILADPLKYICVPEFQKRGAIHFHLVLFNFPFVNHVYKDLREIWGGHRIELKTIRRKNETSDVAAYISKYITKQATDGKFWGQKRYFTSRNIKQPIVLRDDLTIELVCQAIQHFKVYESIFCIPYINEIYYWCYYLGEGKTIHSLLLLDTYAKSQIMLAEKNNSS